MKKYSKLINSKEKEDLSMKLLSKSLLVFFFLLYQYSTSQTVHINPATLQQQEHHHKTNGFVIRVQLRDIQVLAAPI